MEPGVCGMCDAERGPACERGQCKKVYSGTSDSHPDALVASPSTASLVGVIDRSRTIQDITNLDWKSAVACHYMAGGLGSCGAFCVQLADGLVVVKQGSPAASEEYYAAVLAENLHEASGRTMWFTPRTRALEVHHEEALAIKRAIRTSPFTVPEEAYRATMLGSRRRLFVMQYVPGIPIEPSCAPLLLQHPEIMDGIGQWLAYDMLINNFDRLPLIWNNDGNCGNLLFDSNGHVYGIDQRATAIVSNMLEQYLERIHHMIARCRVWSRASDDELAREQESHPALIRVSHFFRVYGGFVLSAAQMRALSAGVVRGCEELVRVATDQLLERSLQRARTELDIEPTGTDLQSAHELVLAARAAIRDALAQRDE